MKIFAKDAATSPGATSATVASSTSASPLRERASLRSSAPHTGAGAPPRTKAGVGSKASTTPVKHSSSSA